MGTKSNQVSRCSIAWRYSIKWSSEIYDDGVAELAEIRSKMASDYEMPPLDMIG